MKYTGRTVNDLIASGFPVSAELGGWAILLIICLGKSRWELSQR